MQYSHIQKPAHPASSGGRRVVLFYFVLILLMLVACLFMFLLTVRATEPVVECSKSQEALGDVAPEGYSIFQETMADMTWQELEQAAKEGVIVLQAGAVVEESVKKKRPFRSVCL